MSHLNATLAARAHRDGAAYRSAMFRHARIKDRPIMLTGWQLGAEPFSAAALGFGIKPDSLHLVVAGEPRNRELAFAALGEFARWFNPRFERFITCVSPRPNRPDHTISVDAPQVVVPNRATIDFLGHVGRQLAYLPDFKGVPPDPDLVRLGQHLQFLERHSHVPGQQLILPLTALLNDHWVIPLSDLERMSLGAVDAFIEPPSGMHGFDAAALAERHPLGPIPDSRVDVELESLLQEFNMRRAGSTDRATVVPLLEPIREHYLTVVQHTWDVCWRCLARERQWGEAPSVARRWEIDRGAFTLHMRWVQRGGHRRTRQTSRQAATLLRRLEETKRRFLAEQALDDPVRMIPYLLDHKAIEGRVIRIDLQHREIARRNRVFRPLAVIETTDPCLIPLGRALWWTGNPYGAEWVIDSVVSSISGGSQVTLKLLTSKPKPMPAEGELACFSIHNLDVPWMQQLPDQTPWTHAPLAPQAVPGSLEDSA